jgi:hypothetical protein
LGVTDPFGAAGAPGNVPGIVWADITNPLTGDEQNFTGLIVSSVALILSSTALLIIVLMKKKKEEVEVEKQ